MKKKVFILTGEHSGDFYGAALAKNLKDLDPELNITGIGSERMKNAGVELLYDSADWSAVGLLESSLHIPRLLCVFKALKAYIKKNKFDLLVLIDFPAFNMRLARFARLIGLKTVYYFPPSAWSKKIDRPLAVSSIVDKVITPFAYTRDIYLKAGKDAVFLGHPIVGLLRPKLSREEAFDLFNISPDKFLISLFPGSRIHEIKYMLPVLIDAAKIIGNKLPHVQFAVSCVSSAMEKMIKHYLEKSDFNGKIIVGYSHDLMCLSYFLLVTSGTATLEAAYLGIPMVIVYKISPLSWFIAIKTLDLPDYAGLPNLILQRKVVPELIQNNVTGDNLAQVALDILLNPDKMNEMKAVLREVVDNLGPPGAAERIAGEIYSML